MDNLGFKSGEENDIYFSNGMGSEGESNPERAPLRTVKKKKKKGSGIGSTYMFFIVV